ncbi:MAG: TetR/AcrR family transcriptional regulator [Candidatus Methanoplasma sp.]|jgi:AcrR family transcriptional regulator|nr:TetR/AcrR family transcriptional regulator [Candidatus Methanoplasma sp.]
MSAEQGKRQLQKEATRERILRTAAAVYSERGFATPTNVITQEAGISHGSLFVHFSTREDLQISVLERFAQEVCDELHDLSVNNGSVEEMLRAHIGVLKNYELFYRNLVSETALLPRETRTLLVSVQSAMSHHFGTAVEQGQRNGTVKDLPLHMLFNIWIGLLHYYLQNGDLFAPGSSVLEQCGDELANSFSKLISK